MKKHTKTLLSRLLMAIILFAISPACDDYYIENEMDLTEESLYASIYYNLYNHSNYYSSYIDKGGDDGILVLSCEGSRFSLTGVPDWITLDGDNFESGKGTEVYDREIGFHVEPNWTCEDRKATLVLTAHSSDGVSISDECEIKQETYTADDLRAYIYCTNSVISGGSSASGTLKIKYRGDNTAITGVPDWITVESYEFARQTTSEISIDLDYTVTANNTGSTREAKITITSYLGDGTSKSDYCTITQYSK